MTRTLNLAKLDININTYKYYKVGPIANYKWGEISPISRMKKKQENPFFLAIYRGNSIYN